MKSVHPAIKILTAAVFIVLMSGFVALKSGAFNTRSATIKLDVSRTGVSHRGKKMHNIPEKKTLYTKRALTQEEQRQWQMMASSKTLVASPVDWRTFPTLFGPEKQTLMSSSKSASIAIDYSVYRGIFNVPYRESVKNNRPQLKQGGK